MIKNCVYILLYWGIYLTPIKAQTVAVSAEKYNILYIGVDNPVTIAVEGVFDEKIKASISTGTIQKINKGQYIIRVSTPGEASVNLEWDNQRISKKFRVKVIPDPKTTLIGCNICRPEGISLTHPDCDYPVNCSIQSFTVVYVPKRGDPVQMPIIGTQFSYKLKNIIEKANIGDRLEFINIKALCPGDAISRVIPSLTYIIRG